MSSIVLDGLLYILVARYFGPIEYGYYVSILAFLSLIDLTADMMVLDISVREMAKDGDNLGTWLGASTLLRLGVALAGLVAFAVYVWLGPIHHNPSVMWAAWCACLILPVGAFRTPLAVFRAQTEMHYELVAVVLARLINLLLYVALMFLHGKLYQFFFVVVISRAVLALVAWTIAISRYHIRPRFRLEALLTLVRECWVMGVSGFLLAAQLKGDILMVAAMVGLDSAGMYAVVAQMPEYLLYVPVIITTPILPLLSRAHAESDHARLQQLSQKTFDVVTAIVAPVVVIGCLRPTDCVVLLFGSQYAAAATTLPVLLLSAAFMWFSHVTAIIAIAARLQRNFLWIQCLCAATYFALNRVVIGRWGVIGACEVRLLAMAMAPVLTYWVLERRAALTLDARILRRTLGAAVAIVATMVAFRSLPLYSAGLCSIAAYGAVLAGMHVRLRTSALDTEMGQ